MASLNGGNRGTGWSTRVGNCIFAGMWLRVLIAVAIGYFAYIVIRGMMTGGMRRGRFKCATCKSCGKLFDVGVRCRFQGKETFKNETHISNCIDYERRS